MQPAFSASPNFTYCGFVQKGEAGSYKQSTGTARNTTQKCLLGFVDLQPAIELAETVSDDQPVKAILIVKPGNKICRLIVPEALLPEVWASESWPASASIKPCSCFSLVFSKQNN